MDRSMTPWFIQNRLHAIDTIQAVMAWQGTPRAFRNSIDG